MAPTPRARRVGIGADRVRDHLLTSLHLGRIALRAGNETLATDRLDEAIRILGEAGLKSALSEAFAAREDIATASGQKSSRETTWIVERMSVACTTERRSSAPVRSARRNPSRHDQSRR